jgi:ornithine cyclodeaminase/alanine dehydrogenase-like protein (mu-crystallin family)
MLNLSADDIARLLPMHEAIDVVADAFAAISRHEGNYPARMHMPIVQGDALVMPGCDGHGHFGVKLATIHPGNIAKGKAGTRASYLLIDANDGEPRLLCDGTALTALRTGAAGGLAARRLARKDATTLALFGAGHQAAAQLDAACAVRSISDIRVVSRHGERAERFIATMRARHPGTSIQRAGAHAALTGAQIVVTATNSSTPVLDAASVAAGTHVNAIGSFRPDMCEVDPALFTRARLFVDQRIAALAESGEIVQAIASGSISADAIVELGEIGESARSTDDEVTVFKSVGHAALDLFTAVELLRRARHAISPGDSANVDASR